METKKEEENMHKQAMRWKVNLQEIQEQLRLTEKKINTMPAIDDMGNAIILQKFINNIKHFQKDIKNWHERISHFENQLAIQQECDTSQCDNAFLEEAHKISTGIKAIMKKVEELQTNRSFR